MEAIVHNDVEDFLRRSERHLLSSLAMNHGLVQIATVLGSPNHFHQGPYWYCTVENNGQVVGAALHALPDGLVLSSFSDSSVTEVVDAIIQSGQVPCRVVGEPDHVKRVCTSIESRLRCKYRRSTEWVVGRLDAPAKMGDSPPRGKLRAGELSDLALVRNWGRKYQFEKVPFLDVAEFLEKKLRDADLYIWETDEPATMLTVSGRKLPAVRISSVFTPDEKRCRGHASSAVATLANELLSSDHEFVVLAWRKNDAVGNVYKRLGFRPIGNQLSMSLERESQSTTE